MRLIEPDWPSHPRVRAAFTTRDGGVSRGPYASLNLGLHVGDEPGQVAQNRRRLRDRLGLSREPAWLEQVHGTDVLRLGHDDPVSTRADAAWTDLPGPVCTVMSADCLPVLFADRSGRCVAAAHAGWRGLAAGVLERTLAALPIPPATVETWLGPAIGPRAFEVGDEVRSVFVEADPLLASAFVRHGDARWYCDLFAIARHRLRRAGVSSVHGGDICTHADPARFFSHRRDGVCGRMAALIWLV